MPKVIGIDVRCSNPECRAWFPSPIVFGGTEGFGTSTMVGNTVQCPYCGHMVACNKENMRARYEGGSGGFVGDAT